MSTSRPTISLALTIRSNQPASAIRDLVGLVPLVDEVVAVIVSPDAADTREPWIHALSQLDVPCRTIEISPDSHPHLYSIDCPETFAARDPLCGEIYSGPFSGLPFVADWARIRNLGWSDCSMEWRLALSDDEMITHPEHLAPLCRQLDELDQDVVHFPHHRVCSITFPARLTRRGTIRFEGIARERLVGGSRPTISPDLTITSLQQPTEIEDQRTTRALYAECRRNEWIVPPDDLLHLARSCLSSMPKLASSLLDLYLQTLPSNELRSWAEALVGEICEASGKIEEAASCYEASRSSHPGWKSALRLCRASFKLSRWEDCVNAYGSADMSIPHVHDDGNLDPSSSLILVASSLHQLGQAEEARQIGSSLAEIFPHSPSIMKFCRSLGC